MSKQAILKNDSQDCCLSVEICFDNLYTHVHKYAFLRISFPTDLLAHIHLLQHPVFRLLSYM